MLVYTTTPGGQSAATPLESVGERPSHSIYMCIDELNVKQMSALWH